MPSVLVINVLTVVNCLFGFKLLEGPIKLDVLLILLLLGSMGDEGEVDEEVKGEDEKGLNSAKHTARRRYLLSV